MNESVELLAAAVTDAAPNYAKVTAADLTKPTPCEGWDLRALLNHTLSRLALSAKAARLEPVDSFADIEIDHVGDDPADAFKRLSGQAVDAWRACDDFTTPRVTPMGPIPPEGVLLFGAQDVFIHAWDVATTLGVEPVLSDQMIEVFTNTHRQSVDDATRAAFFAPEIPIGPDANPLDKLVAFLGRQP